MFNMTDCWADKINNQGKPTAKKLTHILYTEGENIKRNRVLEINLVDNSDWILDISMPLLAKILGEKGILHLVDEYCKQEGKHHEAHP